MITTQRIASLCRSACATAVGAQTAADITQDAHSQRIHEQRHNAARRTG